MPGKKYLAEQAATFLKFAKATVDPDVAAGFLEPGFDCTNPPQGPTTCHVETFDIVAATSTGNRAVA